MRQKSASNERRWDCVSPQLACVFCNALHTNLQKKHQNANAGFCTSALLKAKRQRQVFPKKSSQLKVWTESQVQWGSPVFPAHGKLRQSQLHSKGKARLSYMRHCLKKRSKISSHCGFVLALQRQKQEDHHKFEVNFTYMLSPQLSRDTQ